MVLAEALDLSSKPKELDMEDSVNGKKKSMNKFVLACAVLASMNSILLGYDGGVMSGAVIFIRKDLGLNDVEVEMLVGSLNLICLLGAAVAGRTSDAVGRRWTMALAALVFFLGSVAMALAPSFAWLMVGRLLGGIGVGYALLIAPVYTAEVAPAATRGALTCFPEIFINVGIFFWIHLKLCPQRLAGPYQLEGDAWIRRPAAHFPGRQRTRHAGESAMAGHEESQRRCLESAAPDRPGLKITH